MLLPICRFNRCPIGFAPSTVMLPILNFITVFLSAIDCFSHLLVYYFIFILFSSIMRTVSLHLYVGAYARRVLLCICANFTLGEIAHDAAKIIVDHQLSTEKKLNHNARIKYTCKVHFAKLSLSLL